MFSIPPSDCCARSSSMALTSAAERSCIFRRCRAASFLSRDEKKVSTVSFRSTSISRKHKIKCLQICTLHYIIFTHLRSYSVLIISFPIHLSLICVFSLGSNMLAVIELKGSRSCFLELTRRQKNHSGRAAHDPCHDLVHPSLGSSVEWPGPPFAS